MKTLRIRLPDGLCDKADAVLADMGLDLPTAIKLYLTKIVQTRSIPFAVEAPQMGVEAIDADDEIQGDMNNIAKAWKRRRV